MLPVILVLTVAYALLTIWMRVRARNRRSRLRNSDDWVAKDAEGFSVLPGDEQVPIGRFSTNADAEICRLKLEASGIDSVLIGDKPTYSDYAPLIHLCVRAEDAERAVQALNIAQPETIE
jgi:hypothetical protein